MEIVLLILKIIGITLLALLGIVLLLIVLLLFFPISYGIRASYDETINAKVKAHWLFHFISVTLDYGEGVKKCVLRILGIPIMDFLNPKPKKERPAKKVKKTVVKEETPDGKEVTLDDFSKLPEDVDKDILESQEDVSDEAETIAEGFDASEHIEEEPKLTLWQKIKKTIEMIIQKIRDIIQKGVDVKEKAERWVEYLSKDQTKVAISKVKDHIIKLLKHILPRKWNAYVEMGFDDPATTGKILGYYWMFIGLYGNHFVCVPDFEHKVLKANLEAKGRIQIFQFVYVVFQFLFDKDLVYLRKTISKVNS